jgi:hypothetical protein
MSTQPITTPAADPKAIILDFAELLAEGSKCWVNAGKILADAVDRFPNFLQLLQEARPEFPPRFLHRMLELGRGALHEDLLLAVTKGENALARLPFSWQEQYVRKPVELIIKTEAGFDTLLVPVKDLTPEQVTQVFDGSGIRTPAQQRVYLENRWAKKVAPPQKTNLPYRIVGRKLVVMEGVTLDLRELSKIMAEMAE